MKDSFDIRVNRDFWDELAEVHFTSDYYDVVGFLKGADSLRDIEIGLLEDMAGKSVLHLQCHIGLDSISIARRGAHVVAVDFSPKSIDIARQIAAMSGTHVDFIEGDVYRLADLVGARTFDIVFCSYGVLPWLEDLFLWAGVVAPCLKVGGRFVLVDDHPFARTMSGALGYGADYFMAPTFPYANSDTPIETRFTRTYAGVDVTLNNDHQLIWPHSFEELINALLAAGLVIEDFREYFKTTYRMFSNMVLRGDNWWYLTECAEAIPLTFAIVCKQARSRA